MTFGFGWGTPGIRGSGPFVDGVLRIAALSADRDITAAEAEANGVIMVTSTVTVKVELPTLSSLDGRSLIMVQLGGSEDIDYYQPGGTTLILTQTTQTYPQSLIFTWDETNGVWSR